MGRKPVAQYSATNTVRAQEMVEDVSYILINMMRFIVWTVCSCPEGRLSKTTFPRSPCQWLLSGVSQWETLVEEGGQEEGRSRGISPPSSGSFSAVPAPHSLAPAPDRPPCQGASSMGQSQPLGPGNSSFSFVLQPQEETLPAVATLRAAPKSSVSGFTRISK